MFSFQSFMFCFCFSGYVIGILMMAIIIILGVGITFGYFYKRSVYKSQCIYFSFSLFEEAFNLFLVCNL